MIGHLGYQSRGTRSRGVDDDLFHAEADQSQGGLHRCHAPAITDRHESLSDYRFDRRFVRPGAGHCRSDVQNNELVCLLIVEDPDGVDRVANVLRVAELDGFYQSSARK